MAKKTIDIGSSPNKGDGDPLRTAFKKINENFDELYAGNFSDPQNLAANLVPQTDNTYYLGTENNRWSELHVADFIYLNGARIEVTANGTLLINSELSSQVQDIVGSVFSDDSTLLLDGINSSINLDGTVKGNIIPDTDVAYDLGSATNRFRDLYLSGSTIDLGGTTLSIVGGNLQVGGTDIKDVVTAAGVDYSEIQNTPTIPTTLSDLTNDLDYAVIVGGAIQSNGLPVLPTQTLDISGSVFADDSTVLVDGVRGKIVGPVETNSLTVEGVGFVNLNNDAQGNTFYGGATTDKAILLLKGADYLAGSDNGGSITIQGGLARNDGDNGDVTIASGNGGATGTGSVAIIADNILGLTANEISVSGKFKNPLFADIIGSVFADDSTVLVDGVSGKIRGDVENTNVRITSTDSDTAIFSNSYVGIFTDTDNSFHNFVFDTDGYLKVLTDNGGINLNNELNFMSSGAPSSTLSLNSGVLEVITNSGFRLKNNAGTTQLEYIENGFGILRARGTIETDVLTNVSGTLNINGNVDFGNAGTIDFTGSSFTGEPWISLADLKTLVAASTDFSDFQSRIAAL